MTNAAAIGYMLLAARRLKFDRKLQDELERAMDGAMDEYTEYEAEEVYRNDGATLG